MLIRLRLTYDDANRFETKLNKDFFNEITILFQETRKHQENIKDALKTKIKKEILILFIYQ